MQAMTDLVRVPATAIEARRTAQDWRSGLPILRGRGLTLRELGSGDATSLLAMVTTSEVARFISPPPNTREGFERFIAWARARREDGAFACFGIVPDRYETPVGLFQIQRLGPGFEIAEWGFVLASEFWGSGLFVEGAREVLEFAFRTLGVRRLEAKAVLHNGRGNGALRKLGAVQEGVMPQAFLKGGRYFDQAVWAIHEDEWRRAKTVWAPKLH